MNQTIPIVNEIQTGGQEVITLENLIKGQIEQIDKVKDELREKREMLQDSFSNNPTYREKEEKAKTATQEKSRMKKEIEKQPSVAKLSSEVDDLRADLKEKKKTLSNLLVDYEKKTEATQLELFNGVVLDIVETVKLVKRGK